MPGKHSMKNIASHAEIAFWDAAISLMSRRTTPRVYSQMVATMTLRLQPISRTKSLQPSPEKTITRWLQWAHLGIISIASLLLGILLGWIRSN
jgi:hypothetical protein